MIQKILVSLVSVGVFFLGCGIEERPDAYVSQPSVLLTNYNISHMRLHINSAYSGILTFSDDSFTYESAKQNFQGTWSATEMPTVISNDETIAVIQSIEYITDDGYSLSTTFISHGFELEIGDTYILTGDHLLSGTLTQIELNSF
ncbi:MAG: hypothetical protein U9R50_03535 [Campylobacterota bacterium]|nr:hypothetical protein [Campylobacterota bacterium]